MGLTIASTQTLAQLRLSALDLLVRSFSVRSNLLRVRKGASSHVFPPTHHICKSLSCVSVSHALMARTQMLKDVPIVSDYSEEQFKVGARSTSSLFWLLFRRLQKRFSLASPFSSLFFSTFPLSHN